jgi:hypothetical protein
MKRKLYRITSSVGHNTTKNAWNSSIREIEKLVREMATAENTVYTLTGTNGEKDSIGNHIRGYREWQSKEGKYVMFDIEKEA